MTNSTPEICYKTCPLLSPSSSLGALEGDIDIFGISYDKKCLAPTPFAALLNLIHHVWGSGTPPKFVIALWNWVPKTRSTTFCTFFTFFMKHYNNLFSTLTLQKLAVMELQSHSNVHMGFAYTARTIRQNQGFASKTYQTFASKSLLQESSTIFRLFMKQSGPWILMIRHDLIWSILAQGQTNKSRLDNQEHDNYGVKNAFSGVPLEAIKFRNPEKGAFSRGRCANLSQIVRQICAKLLVFRTSHEGCTKLSQICRKFESRFRTILCKYPFSNV